MKRSAGAVAGTIRTHNCVESSSRQVCTSRQAYRVQHVDTCRYVKAEESRAKITENDNYKKDNQIEDN